VTAGKHPPHTPSPVPPSTSICLCRGQEPGCKRLWMSGFCAPFPEACDGPIRFPRRSRPRNAARHGARGVARPPDHRGREGRKWPVSRPAGAPSRCGQPSTTPISPMAPRRVAPLAARVVDLLACPAPHPTARCSRRRRWPNHRPPRRRIKQESRPARPPIMSWLSPVFEQSCLHFKPGVLEGWRMVACAVRASERPSQPASASAGPHSILYPIPVVPSLAQAP